MEPTVEPTAEPAAEPSVDPSSEPTLYPTGEPPIYPTAEPSISKITESAIYPTAEPTFRPSLNIAIVSEIEVSPLTSFNLLNLTILQILILVVVGICMVCVCIACGIYGYHKANNMKARQSITRIDDEDGVIDSNNRTKIIFPQYKDYFNSGKEKVLSLTKLKSGKAEQVKDDSISNNVMININNDDDVFAVMQYKYGGDEEIIFSNDDFSDETEDASDEPVPNAREDCLERVSSETAEVMNDMWESQRPSIVQSVIEHDYAIEGLSINQYTCVPYFFDASCS